MIKYRSFVYIFTWRMNGQTRRIWQTKSLITDFIYKTTTYHLKVICKLVLKATASKPRSGNTTSRYHKNYSFCNAISEKNRKVVESLWRCLVASISRNHYSQSY